MPFDYALLHGGKPAMQSLYMLSVGLLNLLLNILFIPIFGFVGAAIGTSIAMFSAGFFLVMFLHFSFNIFSWRKVEVKLKVTPL